MEELKEKTFTKGVENALEECNKDNNNGFNPNKAEE